MIMKHYRCERDVKNNYCINKEWLCERRRIRRTSLHKNIQKQQKKEKKKILPHRNEHSAQFDCAASAPMAEATNLLACDPVIKKKERKKEINNENDHISLGKNSRRECNLNIFI